MRGARWMAAGTLLAACAANGGTPPLVGRWDGPRGYTEFRVDGRYVMAVTGGARMLGSYTVLDGGRVAITYDAVPGRADTMAVTVAGDSLRLCEPRRRELPCPALVRAGP